MKPKPSDAVTCEHNANAPTLDSPPAVIPMPHPIGIGQMLAERYEIKACLGEGGMGIVYHAHDHALREDVALKTILPERLHAPHALEQLRHEVRSARKIAHPNVCRVFDLQEYGEIRFLTMEFINGQSLRAILRHGPLEPGRALSVFRQVTAGIAAAHEAHFVHRDIKPENILIRKDGHAVVADFGLARRVDDTSKTGNPFVGTPGYMSPEQLTFGPIRTQSDVFALGIVFFEVLTGRSPFGTGSIEELANAILRLPPEPFVMKTLPNDVEAAIARILDKALCKDPAGRFPSAVEFAQALEQIHLDPSTLDNALHPARNPTPSSHDAKPVEPSSHSSLETSFIHQTNNVPRHSASSPTSLHKRPRPLRRWLQVGVVIAVLACGIVYLALRLEPSRVSATTDLPMPPSNHPEAIEAYRRGLHNIRSGLESRGEFEKAVTLDPSLAAAHLQLALDSVMNTIDDSTRTNYRKAQQFAANLSPRDRAVLHGIEPLYTRQPADWAEASTRFSRVVEQFEHDAQSWLYLGLLRLILGQVESALDALDHASREDSRFIPPLVAKAELLSYLGRFTEARETIAACDRIELGAPRCAIRLAPILIQQGKCTELETLGRNIAAAGGNAVQSSLTLAIGLAAQDKPLATIQQALGIHNALGAHPKPHDVLVRVAAASWAGDFDVAENIIRTNLQTLEQNKRRDIHAEVTQWLVELLVETDRMSDAGREAMTYLDRLDAWDPDPRAEDYAIALDHAPLLLAVAERTGQIDRKQFVKRRDAWIADWERRVSSPMYKNFLWLQGYAAFADTPENAREALEALPRFSPIPPFRPNTFSWGLIGAAYHLQGQNDMATKWLREATQSCNGLIFPFKHTRAHLWLGRTLERAGDVNGACAAYHAVLQRWGRAKPKSVTADAAQQRLQSLTCPSL